MNRVSKAHKRGGLLCGVLVILGFTLYRYPLGLSGTTIFLVTGVVVAIGLIRGLKATVPLLPWAFVGLALLSSVWSDSPGRTLLAGSALAVPLLAAGLIARNIPFEIFLRITDRVLRSILIVSVAVALLLPSVGLTQRAHNFLSFQGVFDHRNSMGLMLTLGVITHLARLIIEKRLGFKGLAWLTVYLVALAWTGSGAAIALVTSSLLFYAITRFLSSQTERNRALLSALFLCVGVVIAVFAAQLVPWILELSGRDLTISSRMLIWRGALEAWSHRPLLGYGWGEVLGTDDPAYQILSAYAGYPVRSVHNGYLAVALQLGAIGLALALMIMIGLIVRSFRGFTRFATEKGFWVFMMVITMVAGDFVESRSFANIGWFVVALASCYLVSPEAKDATHSAHPQKRSNNQPFAHLPPRNLVQ